MIENIKLVLQTLTPRVRVRANPITILLTRVVTKNTKLVLVPAVGGLIAEHSAQLREHDEETIPFLNA